MRKISPKRKKFKHKIKEIQHQPWTGASKNLVGKSYCHSIAPSLFSQVSKASQLLSSCCGNHQSSSGPYPTQHTRYWCPLPLHCSSMILSIAYSSMPSDVMIRLGLICLHNENNDALFSVKCLSCKAWKVGKILGEFGKSKVYAENSGMLLIILYGPSNWRMNLVTCDGSPAMNSCWQCNVNNITQF